MALTAPRGFAGGPMADIDYGMGGAGSSFVETPNDFTVTQPNSGTRTVSIAPGTADAFGIRVTNDAAIPQVLAAPGSGGQWYLLVLRFVWTGTSKGVSFQVVAGGSTGSTTPPQIIPVIPGTVNKTPGGTWDLPLAWAFTNSANTTVTLFDVRMVRDGVNGVSAQTLSALILANAMALFSANALIPVGLYQTPFGDFHDRSIWVRRTGGLLLPSGRIVVGGAGARAELAALNTANYIAMQAGETMVFDTGALAEYRWAADASAFKLWNAADVLRTTWASFLNDGYADAFGLTALSVVSGHAVLAFSTTRDAGILPDQTMLQMASGYRPAGTVFFDGRATDASGNRSGAGFRVDSTGTVYLDFSTGTGLRSIAGSVTFRIAA